MEKVIIPQSEYRVTFKYIIDSNNNLTEKQKCYNFLKIKVHVRRLKYLLVNVKYLLWTGLIQMFLQYWYSARAFILLYLYLI